MNVASDPAAADPWTYLWSLGYRRLIPIRPREKIPAIEQWNTRIARQDDFAEWRGFGVGIVGGHEACGTDADCWSEETAGAAAAVIEKFLPGAPTRVGRAPKALFVFRPIGRVPYSMFEFGEKNEQGKRQRIEIISHGKQFVAWGIHPETKAPYRWTRRLVPVADLPALDAAGVAAMMAELRAALPDAGPLSSASASSFPDQETLRGDPETIRRAVAAIANTDAHFPSRESYIKFGYAIKGAVADEALAFEIYWSWCERWTGGVNDPELARADFDRMRGPYELGATWLFHKAAELDPAAFPASAPWFEELPPSAPEIGSEPEHEPLFGAPIEERALKTTRLSELDQANVPAQRWLVRDMIPQRCVTLFYGDGGVGKSLAALQLCMAAATGTAWLGMEIGKGPALFLTAEDEMEELHRRAAAIAAGGGVAFAEASDLHLISLAGMDAVMAAPNMKTGLLATTALFGRIEKTIATLRPVVVALDTLADLFGGDEIKRVQARQFIQLLQGLIARSNFDISVILLGHPSVAGMNSGTGTSGSTAWSNSVRSRLYLERRLVSRGDARIEPDQDIRVLSTKKANRGRVGGDIALRWRSGRFVVETASAGAESDLADDMAFMSLLDEFAAAGRAVGPVPSAPTYAPRLFSTHPSGDEIGKLRLEIAMNRLFRQNVIRVLTYGPPSKKHQKIERA